MSTPDDLIDCSALRDHVENLAVALAQWAYRGEAKAPHVRNAADVALSSIDEALVELNRIRTQLVVQVRTYDEGGAR